MPIRRAARALPTALALPAALAFTAFLAAPVSVAYAQDAANGERLYRRCVACHTVEEGGANKAGPNLFGIIGSTSAGRGIDFNYSPALREAAVEWTDENLDQWLANPRAFIKGTRMPIGVAKADQRQDIIAYLKQATQ